MPGNPKGQGAAGWRAVVNCPMRKGSSSALGGTFRRLLRATRVGDLS